MSQINRITFMQRVVRACYQYPLHGTGFMNRLVYKMYLGLYDTWFMRSIRKTLIQSYIDEARTIPAYREIYNDVSDVSLTGLPITNKANFHIAFQDVRDRLPDGISDEQFNSLEIMKTSGSTTGIPSQIPMSPDDVTNLCNYYQNVSLVSDGIFPPTYWYINMFPTSNSSTGIMSERLVPESYRLGRSNADPVATFNLFADALINLKVTDGNPIVLGGLPIMHMEFLRYLKEMDDSETKSTVVQIMKDMGICLYGGESPSVQEKLELHRYYKRVVGIYGSTELGPRLGFSIEPNLVVDIALKQVSEILKAVTNQESALPCTFFYDPYINHFEIVNGSLVNTPLVQQRELKIRWDQDDYCALAKPHDILNILRNNRDQLIEKLYNVDTEYGTDLVRTLDEMLDGTEYTKLLSYYGMLIFYGRKGIVYGGANLDNSFVEKVHHELHEQVKYMAISRFELPNHDANGGLTIDQYSGLRLDILVEPTAEYDGHVLKETILEIMKKNHHDLELIIGYCEAKGRMDEVHANMHLWVFKPDESPMHHNFEKSKKRNYILKKVGDEYKQTALKF